MKAPASRRRLLIGAQTVLTLVFFALPCFGVGGYHLSTLNQIGIYTILAMSLNVILGHAGMFHMGHAAFFAVGAYTSAILNVHFGWPMLTTLPVAGLAAGLVALLVAAPIIHLRGDYLLMVTIGIVEIVRIILENNPGGYTEGRDGLGDIANLWPMSFESFEVQYFYIIWGFALVTMVMMRWLELSRFGRALKYIREDAVAAENMGIHTARCKLLAFALGALWAGFAGTFFASYMTHVSPESFSFDESVKLFMIVILGGSGRQRGVLLGAFLVIGLPELFRDLEKFRMLVFGAALVAMMIFRPQGIWPRRPREYASLPLLDAASAAALPAKAGEDTK